MLHSNCSVAREDKETETNVIPAVISQEPQMLSDTLPHGKWSPTVHRLLQSWLIHLKCVPDTDSMVAVFDFDNTCIYRDVGKVVFRFQLLQLHFRISPEQLENIFPDSLDSVGGKSFTQVKNRIVTLYKALWPSLQNNQRSRVLQTPEHEEFEALFFWYCTSISEEQGADPRHSLSFLAKLLSGYSTEEVDDITCQAITSALDEPIVTTEKTIQCCEDIGGIEVCYAKGLRVHDEIVELMKQLQHVGVRCCIVSASHEWIIKATALFFDLPVQQDDIYGIRLQRTNDNVFTSNPVANYPVTYREGKVRVVDEFINAVPVLVAGDAVTDFEMLTIPMVPTRLIINHNKRDLISSLYDDPRFLLQGLDKETGCFRPHRETLEEEKMRLDCTPESKSSFQQSLCNAA